MTLWQRFAHALHITSLGIWFGVIGLSAVAAGVIFATIRPLAPRAPSFEKFTGEHWWIVAGKPAHRLFTIVDSVQLALALVAVGTFGVLAVSGALKRSAASLIRGAAIGLAMLMFGYYLFVVSWRMDVNIKAFWDAAAKGDTLVAQEKQRAFDADHPTASRLFSGIGICVLVAAVVGAMPEKKA